MSRNLILFGMMGVGKSTVAVHVAEMLGRGLVSTDVEVERRAGVSIPEVFAGPGEEVFRELEAAVIADLADIDDVVVDLGGGAVIVAANQRVLRHGGFLVLLTAPAEVLEGRLADQPGTRPLLDTADPVAELRRLAKTRAPLYDAAADVVVDATGPPEEVARSVVEAAMAAGDVLTPGEHEQVLA